MVRRHSKLGNPNVSYPRYTTRPFSKWRRYFTLGAWCSSIASAALRLTPIPLLHLSPSTKLQRMYKSHYELLLLLCFQLGLHLGLFLQVLLLQNPGNAGLSLLSVVHPAPSDNRTNDDSLFTNLLCQLFSTNLICTRWRHDTSIIIISRHP
jgi:hypothetical protein